MLIDLEKLLSPSPEGLCLIDYAPNLSPTFLFIHFISQFSKKSFALRLSNAEDPDNTSNTSGRVIFVSLHTTQEFLRISMGKMAQRLDSETLHFIPIINFLGDTFLFDSVELFGRLTEAIQSAIQPGRRHLLILDDLLLVHPSIKPSKLLQFLLNLRALLPDGSFLVTATGGEPSRMAPFAANFFNVRILIRPIGAGLGKNITGEIEVFQCDLARESLPRRTLLHYHCGQRSAKTFVPGSVQLLM